LCGITTTVICPGPDASRCTSQTQEGVEKVPGPPPTFTFTKHEEIISYLSKITFSAILKDIYKRAHPDVNGAPCIIKKRSFHHDALARFNFIIRTPHTILQNSFQPTEEPKITRVYLLSE
jgi:hypothetical protein